VIPPLNSMSVVGVAHDVQQGFLGPTAVTQFSVTTLIANVDDGTEEVHTLASSAAKMRGTARAKETYAVRCMGDEIAAQARQTVQEGSLVEVNGRLALNPQADTTGNLKVTRNFPFIRVRDTYGSVKVLHSKVTQRAKQSSSKS